MNYFIKETLERSLRVFCIAEILTIVYVVNYVAFDGIVQMQTHVTRHDVQQNYVQYY